MKTPLKIALIALVVVVAAAGVGLWWFFKDDAPAPVSLGAAVESVTDSTAAPTTSDTHVRPHLDQHVDRGRSTATTAATGAGTADGGVAGTWVVDTETGEFDYESATGTFAGFRIEEELASIGSTTAVGRTGDVAGSMVDRRHHGDRGQLRHRPQHHHHQRVAP